MQMYEIQAARPDCMQALVDTKPRYRAETERGRFPAWRKSAAHRYQSWAKGPVVSNSVVVDLWSDHPFRGLWEKPGEIAIFQSGDANDWKRILALLDAFVKAEIKGRERRIIADECLDFTRETRGASTPRTMCITGQHGQAVNATSASTCAPIRLRECRRSFSRCYPVSRCFISCQTTISSTCIRRSGSLTANRLKVTTCSASGYANQEALFRGQSRADSCCQTTTYGSLRRRKKG
jgi:hypothetical protein